MKYYSLECVSVRHRLHEEPFDGSCVEVDVRESGKHSLLEEAVRKGRMGGRRKQQGGVRFEERAECMETAVNSSSREC